MKKIYFLILSSPFIFPIISRAADIKPGTIPDAGKLGIAQDSPIKTVDQGVNVLAATVGWIYRIFFIIAVLFIILAAYSYLTKGGEPEKIKETHKRLVYAAVAIAVALLAVGFQTIISNFLASPTSGLNPTNPPGIDPGNEMG